ncbi:MAG TPA: hypothetical protein VFE46_11005 [Pirellulales bacterium]|nr:hypothetical protein [Pirellulales bacterium]
MWRRNATIAWVILICVSVGLALRGESSLPLPPPPPTAAPAAQQNTPNQVLADLAKVAILKSIHPEYEKQENWGHQKEVFDGYQWQQRADGWHLEKQTKKVNDGQWRMYRVRLNDPEHNLQLSFTPPQTTSTGGTAFQATLSARLWAEAIQEEWLRGIKGLNFHVEGYATIEARLDIVIDIHPVAGASFGTIEVLPQVTGVNLKLTDLTLTKIDMLHGDAAKELGHAFKNIVADEVHKREPEITAKINAEIQKHRDKLQFSPAQIAQIGWGKIQTLLGGLTGSSPDAKATAKK